MKKKNFNLQIPGLGFLRISFVSVVIIFTTTWIGSYSSANAQMGLRPQKMDSVYQKVDKMPLFNGNEAWTFIDWVAKQIRYPEDAIKNKITGRVTVRFVVEKDGALSSIEVLKGVDLTLDNEAIRAIKSSPKWTPGMKNNVPVRVSLFIPVEFKTTFPSDAKLKVKQ
jgi:TonB family protein